MGWARVRAAAASGKGLLPFLTQVMLQPSAAARLGGLWTGGTRTDVWLHTQGISALKVYTQIGALICAFVCGARRAVQLQPFAGSSPLFVTATTLELVAGAMVLRFAVDHNEVAGLGEGVALLICAGFGSSALRHPLPQCKRRECDCRE